MTKPPFRRPQIRRQSTSTNPSLPKELQGAVCLESAVLSEVPTPVDLAAWLKDRGVSTDSWGEGNTKTVAKLHKELVLEEASLEVYSKGDEKKVIRSTHVLRGKVCSQKSYERSTFLFNTWQQFADGRKRTRNGLLSEKLSTSEVPLEKHLDAVCKRAVEEEEMQCLVEAGFVLGPGIEAPELDPEYRSSLCVERAQLTDYTLELEESKSFPGLVTMYHLYTVDIICSGLPGVDFNTLEFEEPEEDGTRRLKYVHAWNWLRWPMIQRYLFEGSSLKETKRRGSFQNEDELRHWLQEYAIDTDEWGKSGFKSVETLFTEVENEEAQLELWGRHDGVPLLMRVVHVIQVKVVSEDPRLENKFLLHSFMQARDGRVRTVNRLLSKKLSCSQVPFDEGRFTQAAKQIVVNQLTHLTDVHFGINTETPPKPEDIAKSEVEVTNVRILGKHFDIEESPSFKGMNTMYHLYTMELEVDGLPVTDFSSVDFVRYGGPHVSGWRWTTLSETMDVLHNRAQAFSRQESRLRKCLRQQREELDASIERLSRIKLRLQFEHDEDAGSSFGSSKGEEEEDKPDVTNELSDITTCLKTAARHAKEAEKDTGDSFAADALPPAMLSKMAKDSVVSESFFEEKMCATCTDGRKASVPFIGDAGVVCSRSRGRARSAAGGLAMVSMASDPCSDKGRMRGPGAFASSASVDSDSAVASPDTAARKGLPPMPSVTSMASVPSVEASAGSAVPEPLPPAACAVVEAAASSAARASEPTRWCTLGLALGLCAAQATSGLLQLARASRAGDRSTALPLASVVAAVGAGLLVASELRGGARANEGAAASSPRLASPPDRWPPEDPLFSPAPPPWSPPLS